MVTKFSHAFRGLSDSIKTDRSIRIHVLVAAGVIVAATFVCISREEWIILIVVIGLVLAIEMVNSAVEYLGDLFDQGMHPVVGRAKDIAAGAVLVAAITAAIVGILVLLPPVLSGKAGVCWIEHIML